MTDRRRATALLLAHGPLSLSEFSEITGWSYRCCYLVLGQMVDDGFLVRPRRGVYQLGSGANIYRQSCGITSGQGSL
jgi:hypothetical protein